MKNNENKNVDLEQFLKKMQREAFLKSLMFAAIIAFLASFAASFIIWFFDVKGLWISIGIFAALLAALTPAIYFLKYRPSNKDVARRLDRLGLDERIITMTELEGDDSVMAIHQRESARKSLNGVSGKMLKVAVSGLMVAALVISGAAGISMITVEALSKEDKISSGKEIVNNLKPEDPEVFYTVKYEIAYVEQGMFGVQVVEGEGCEIDGNDEQLVLAGGDAEPVLVYVADDVGEDWGWVFVGWYDDLSFENDPDSTDPYRQDLAVSLGEGNFTVDEDGNYIITHYAVFLKAQMDPNGDGEGDGEPGEGEEGDQPGDQPGEPGEGEPGEGEPGEGEDGPGAGGIQGDNDKIVDGETDYHGYVGGEGEGGEGGEGGIVGDYMGAIQ